MDLLKLFLNCKFKLGINFYEYIKLFLLIQLHNIFISFKKKEKEKKKEGKNNFNNKLNDKSNTDSVITFKNYNCHIKKVPRIKKKRIYPTTKEITSFYSFCFNRQPLLYLMIFCVIIFIINSLDDLELLFYKKDKYFVKR